MLMYFLRSTITKYLGGMFSVIIQTKWVFKALQLNTFKCNDHTLLNLGNKCFTTCMFFHVYSIFWSYLRTLKMSCFMILFWILFYSPTWQIFPNHLSMGMVCDTKTGMINKTVFGTLWEPGVGLEIEHC